MEEQVSEGKPQKGGHSSNRHALTGSGLAAGRIRAAAREVALQQIEERYGAWTAHTLDLGDGVLTIKGRRLPDFTALMGTIEQFSGRSLRQCRVLDPGCLEGMFAFEFARRGADVLGVEGRKANIEKCYFARDMLSYPNISFLHEDVLKLNRKRQGVFDIIFCKGLLYHLNTPEVFSFLEHMFSMCRGMLFLNTHIASETVYSNRERLSALTSVLWEGLHCEGRFFTEHPRGSSQEEKEARLWSSLHNEQSFWFTRNSLLEILHKLGFARVFEYHSCEFNTPDRTTFIAVKDNCQ